MSEYSADTETEESDNSTWVVGMNDVGVKPIAFETRGDAKDYMENVVKQETTALEIEMVPSGQSPVHHNPDGSVSTRELKPTMWEEIQENRGENTSDDH